MEDQLFSSLTLSNVRPDSFSVILHPNSTKAFINDLSQEVNMLNIVLLVNSLFK